MRRSIDKENKENKLLIIYIYMILGVSFFHLDSKVGNILKASDTEQAVVIAVKK